MHLEIDRRTTALRFTIQPPSSGAVDLLDSWVIRVSDPAHTVAQSARQRN
jgi:hypothetical protein